MASVATGSTAEISDPNVRLHQTMPGERRVSVGTTTWTTGRAPPVPVNERDFVSDVGDQAKQVDARAHDDRRDDGANDCKDEDGTEVFEKVALGHNAAPSTVRVSARAGVGRDTGRFTAGRHLVQVVPGLENDWREQEKEKAFRVQGQHLVDFAARPAQQKAQGDAWHGNDAAACQARALPMRGLVSACVPIAMTPTLSGM